MAVTPGHSHDFDAGNPAAERGTRLVMWITAVTMVVEIVAGWWFNSMALLADGWHMSSHAVAIGLSAFAYAAARRYANDARFAFGTWKIEVLAGFASAIFLLGVALMMVVGSVERIIAPQAIQYREALVVAVLGLVVNIVCAIVLGRAHRGGHDHPHDHDHDHDHAHDHGHSHGHHDDLNLRSAYLHVIADAVTSVLAIAALTGGLLFGWAWLDPVMGIVGAVLVANWARGLAVDSGKVLLDREMDHPVVDDIRRAVEEGAIGDAHVADLHVWRVGRHAYACAITVVSRDARLTAARVREELAQRAGIAHMTVELHHQAEVREGG